MATVVALKRQPERHLREAVETFLDRPSKLAPSTRRVYRQCLSRMVADLGDELPIEGVTLEDLERHLSDFYSAGWLAIGTHTEWSGDAFD